MALSNFINDSQILTMIPIPTYAFKIETIVAVAKREYFADLITKQ